jgi:hypothetical protein
MVRKPRQPRSREHRIVGFGPLERPTSCRSLDEYHHQLDNVAATMLVLLAVLLATGLPSSIGRDLAATAGRDASTAAAAA